MTDKAEGWSVDGKTATFNGGRLYEVFSCGKKVAEDWTYVAKVTMGDGGLTIDVSDDDDTRGQAHGGSYTNLTIPHDILTQLTRGDQDPLRLKTE